MAGPHLHVCVQVAPGSCPSSQRSHGSTDTSWDYCGVTTASGCECLNAWADAKGKGLGVYAGLKGCTVVCIGPESKQCCTSLFAVSGCQRFDICEDQCRVILKPMQSHIHALRYPVQRGVLYWARPSSWECDHLLVHDLTLINHHRTK
jgi:hypothetical protein